MVRPAAPPGTTVLGVFIFPAIFQVLAAVPHQRLLLRELEQYKGHTIVGFPTVPAISELEGIEDHLVLAGDASMEDQFTWLRLGERFWVCPS